LGNEKHPAGSSASTLSFGCMRRFFWGISMRFIRPVMLAECAVRPGYFFHNLEFLNKVTDSQAGEDRGFWFRHKTASGDCGFSSNQPFVGGLST
jgi:hypothetical protein